MATKKRYRKYGLIALVLLLVFVSFTIWANTTISNFSDPFISNNLSELKPVKTGLLLGTSPSLRNGRRNEFFYNRIEATVDLFRNQKIKYVIVSGDNSTEFYNEPLDMKKELVKNGIPDSVIFLDYAGFRTFDSVLRARDIFSQDSILVISQNFHNQRAIYIARKSGMTAFGYNAKEVTAFSSLRTKVREFFARDKVFIDFAIGKQPKYLGEKIKIG